MRKDTSVYAEQNLLREAGGLGVRGVRLSFSFRFPEKDYVPFRALADLMVDNRAYNAHTTGGHLAGRAGTTFAHALGAASMAAPTLRAYEDAVHDLGSHQERMWTLRRRLMALRTTAPFFDLQRLARGQHRLAAAMWGVHAAGLQPMHTITAR